MLIYTLPDGRQIKQGQAFELNGKKFSRAWLGKATPEMLAAYGITVEEAPKKSVWKKIGLFVGVALIAAGLAYGGYYVYQNYPISLPTPEVSKPKINPDQLTKIKETRPFYLSAVRADGQIEVRTGGSHSWRVHNPGMIADGEFARKMGAIGVDGKIAVFPSYIAGRRANEVLLFESEEIGFMFMPLDEAISKYAPKKDGFTPDAYAKKVAEIVGVPLKKKLMDFTSEQRKKMLDAIEQIEKFEAGKVTIYKNEAEFAEKGY